jgi:alpha-glucosidase
MNLVSCLVRELGRRVRPWAIAVLATVGAASVGAEPVVLRSPSGTVEVSFSTGSGGAMLYSVSYAGKPVVADSALGLTLRGTEPLTAGFRVVSVTRASRNEKYTLFAGKTKEAVDRSEEMTVSLERGGGTPARLDLVFRAFDDGAALRYVLPKQAGLDAVELLSENTRFRFLADHRAWALFLESFTTSNEREFVPVPLLAIKPESIVGPPLTIEGDGFVASLAEANLRDWSGLHFARVEGGNDSRYPTLVSKLAPLPSRPDAAQPAAAVRGTLPMRSPWRVIMLGRKPGDLVESTIITSLADPSEVADTSWIEPGKVAWDWWSGPSVGPAIPGAPFAVGMNDATYRYMADFAAEFGLKHVIIDAGWYGDHRDPKADITKPIPGLDEAGLAAYGKTKGVGFIVWLNWEAVNATMDRAFPVYEKWGLAGLKIDYMDRKDQEIVDFYHRTVRAAAKHRLTVDFHGAYAGSGEERTFPHWLTREGVMGLEYCKWSDRVGARHDVTIPFTRMLVGPMDYTPGGFRNVTKDAFAPRMELPVTMTTRAHQLAMYVVYDSPLQMLSDTPPAYRGEPGAEFLKVVPSTWDETKVLDGRIGEYVAIARRHGSDWYIGAMTDAPRKLTVALPFLATGAWLAEVYADAPDAAKEPTRLAVTTSKVAAGATASLTFDLAPAGGAAVRLRPAGGER